MKMDKASARLVNQTQDRPTPLGGTPHIASLDGVRGLAIAAVLASHLTGTLRSDIYAPISAVFSYGWMGVDLFFVLSGFLITSILLKTRNNPRYIRDFYIRRALRIWPLYYLYVFLAFAALAVISHTGAYGALVKTKGQFSGDPVANLEMLPIYLLLLQNFLLVNVGGYSVLAATWSLCVEEHFYLIWPPIVRRASYRAMTCVLSSVIVASPLLRTIVMLFSSKLPDGWPHWIIYHMTPFHLDAIAAGSLLAVISAGGRVDISKLHKYLLLTMAVSFSAFVAISLLWPKSAADEILSYTLLSAAFTSLIAYITSGGVRAMFEYRPLRYLGRISYGLYLIHAPIINVLSSHSLMARALPRLPTPLTEAVFSVAGVAISVVVAIVSREFVEERFLSLKDKFTSSSTKAA